MDEDWDSANDKNDLIVRNILATNITGDGEVQDSWEDVADSWEQVADAIVAEPQPQTSTAKEPKKAEKSKPKNKSDKAQEAQVEERKLTAHEIEQLQRQSELQNLADTFGLSVESKESNVTFHSQELTSKEDFKKYSEFLTSQIGQHHKKKEYIDFLSDVFKSLCLELEADNVKRFGKELTFLGNELYKREKEAEKQQKQKNTKKPAISVGKRGMLDDIADGADYYGGGDDDDDFM